MEYTAYFQTTMHNVSPLMTVPQQIRCYKMIRNVSEANTTGLCYLIQIKLGFMYSRKMIWRKNGWMNQKLNKHSHIKNRNAER
jgi:ABC-type cobalamin/Fe3+-siderophores transport system ATPase subunit